MQVCDFNFVFGRVSILAWEVSIFGFWGFNFWSCVRASGSPEALLTCMQIHTTYTQISEIHIYRYRDRDRKRYRYIDTGIQTI